jgi:hypothetical protein
MRLPSGQREIVDEVADHSRQEGHIKNGGHAAVGTTRSLVVRPLATGWRHQQPATGEPEADPALYRCRASAGLAHPVPGTER